MAQTGTGQTAHTQMISLGSWTTGTLQSRINTFLAANSLTWATFFGAPSPFLRMPLIRVYTTSTGASLTDAFGGSIPLVANAWNGPYTIEDASKISRGAGDLTVLIEC